MLMCNACVIQEAVIHPDLYGVRRSNRPHTVPSSSLLYEVGLSVESSLVVLQCCSQSGYIKAMNDIKSGYAKYTKITE